MADSPKHRPIPLDSEHPIWERCFIVAPLVVVGTREADGHYDFAPKHMVVPLGWENHFGFVCTPSHNTYQNARREGCFTVSFPRPEQVVLTSLAASPRCEDNSKPCLDALPTFAATKVDGMLLEDAYLHLECEVERIVDGFGRNSLVAGHIVAAQAAEDYLRDPDVDDQELLDHAPVLAYLYPRRYTAIAKSLAFPFPEGFSR